VSVRVAVGDPRTISVEFPGVATGNVSVSVYSSRLGLITGPFTATSGGSGVYSHALTADDVEAVDKLRLTYTGTVDGTVYTRTEWVDVAGAYYFTVSEARATGPIDAQFSDADIERMRTAVEDQIEANCDTSFVARFFEESVSGSTQFVRLRENYVLNLVKCLEDGTDVTSTVELDGRFLWRGSLGSWSSGHRNVVVQYEACFDETPPADLRRKAIEATRYGLLREKRQGLPPQAVTLGTDAGTLRLAVAGLRQPFGLPEVDAVVLKWAKRTCVPIAGT
jgi:hypothetical protein